MDDILDRNLNILAEFEKFKIFLNHDNDEPNNVISKSTPTAVNNDVNYNSSDSSVLTFQRYVEDGRLIFCKENGEVVFGIMELETNDGVEIITEGSITPEVASCFEDELISAALAYDKITLNLNKTESVSDRGLRAVLDAQNCIDNLADKEMIIRKLSPSMRAAFDKMGYYELFLYTE